jgi:hypothetical protein
MLEGGTPILAVAKNLLLNRRTERFRLKLYKLKLQQKYILLSILLSVTLNYLAGDKDILTIRKVYSFPPLSLLGLCVEQ